MNDMQILTLAISFAVPIALLFLGNSRITDVKEGLRAEIKLSEANLDAKISRVEMKLESKIDRIDQKLDAILKILAVHEAKLQH